MSETWNVARWRGRHWAAALVVLLSLTLLPLGWVQWQQFKLLSPTYIQPLDALADQLSEMDSTLDRLNDRIQVALSPEATASREALRLHHEALTTQARRLQDLAQPTDVQPIAVPALDVLRALLASSEALLASPAEPVSDRDALGRLSSMADGVRSSFAALATDVQLQRATVLQQHERRGRQLAVTEALLIALLALSATGLVALVALRMRRQRQQFQKLQKLSNRLAHARDEAELANHSKSVFLANMSHEIRTPFQGLLGMLDLLEEPNLTGRQRDYIQTARDSALHLLGVLNDILDVATMDSGTLKLAHTPVNLRRLVHEVETLMQESARDKGLALDVYTAGNLPEWVLTDAARLRQILFNLLSNAIKFTSSGSVIAEVARAPDKRDGVVITVRDTGTGMDEETLNRLFTRFYQADSSLRRRAGGSGLGLEISRNLARMMGGDIEVQSQPRVGSVFTVTLALPETAAPPQDVPDMPKANRRATPLRVLVAEDHPINLKYMSILLENMGHNAVFCENGQQALDLLGKDSFDVVLLDYHMPVLDGLATTEAIRALDGPAARTKVVLITADVVNDTRKRASEVGVDAFTSKPLQAQDLQRALQHCGLLETGSSDTEGGSAHSSLGGLFPISAYELPVRLPDEKDPSILIDSESFTDIASLMPEDTLAELLTTLFKPPEGSVHVLLTALENHDLAAVGYNAHKLKGTAMLMGFRAIVQTAARIEEMVRKGEDPCVGGLSFQLRHDMEHTQKALSQFGVREWR
ncbi:ATP-binding protein [Hydrogenophaga sp.]|uniref:ATP-binding protein n=1 Tax=Hydrogenophaga sp. TaxID=1904254 RepID=UPI002725EF46|nr:ATP-binding protein [Hydrogenophaga sp.]MDO8906141.1 ATP-binding protein [Hydrogenophaga sp.]